MQILNSRNVRGFAWACAFIGMCSAASSDPTLKKGSEIAPTRCEQNNVELDSEWRRLVDGHERRVKKRGGDQFVGYLRGRFRLNPPEWWVRAVRHDCSIDEEASQRTIEKLVGMWRKSEQGWKYYGVDAVCNDRDSLRVQSGDQNIVLKSMESKVFSERGWTAGELGGVSGAFGKDVFAMSVHGAERGALHVGIFSRGSGQLIWNRELSSSFPDGGVSGGWGSLSEVTLENDSAIVWVAHDFGVGVEIMDIQNGSTVAFFSSFHSSIISLEREARGGTP